MARLLLDTCVWGGAVHPLKVHGHDVEWTGKREVDPGDNAILAEAHADRRILITLDKDFGELAILKGLPHFGIVRLSGFRAGQMAEAIHLLITAYEQDLLEGAIVTADPKRVRIRRVT
jgi:predicted nuclease of predicted toxin-antitoxin system